MARENVGEIECPACHTTQPVRKDKKGKVYINCNNCGILQFALDGGQKWIMEHATIYGVNPPPASDKKPPADDALPPPANKLVDPPAGGKGGKLKAGPAAPAAKPAPAPAPAKRGILDDVI